MEKLKQIRKLRKGWKIFIAAMLALIVFGGVGMYVAASSNVKITMSVGGLTVIKERPQRRCMQVCQERMRMHRSRCRFRKDLSGLHLIHR